MSAATATGRMILGASPPVQALLKLIDKVAASKTSVLVIGESGTGKELVARLIHEKSPLANQAFVAVNCGAIPENLIESELFGHKRGSFTGAVADKEGLFEVANHGTLFLDEVGELPLAMQVKLLRAIQDRSFRRVGSNDLVKVDVRIIAATNRDLEAMIAQGKFREDLYYRLNVILIKTPPLRERKGDVRMLADAFLKRVSERHGRPMQGFEPEVLAAMEAYAWPGNVRELENMIERSVALETGVTVGAASLPPALQKLANSGAAASAVPLPPLPPPHFEDGPIDLDAILKSVERAYLAAALDFARNDAEAAAALLSRKTDRVKK